MLCRDDVRLAIGRRQGNTRGSVLLSNLVHTGRPAFASLVLRVAGGSGLWAHVLGQAGEAARVTATSRRSVVNGEAAPSR